MFAILASASNETFSLHFTRLILNLSRLLKHEDALHTHIHTHDYCLEIKFVKGLNSAAAAAAAIAEIARINKELFFIHRVTSCCNAILGHQGRSLK